MPRRAVIAAVTAALVVGGGVAPAVAAALEPSQVCLITDRDPQTGKRTGFCVWVPVEPPVSADGAS